MTRNPEIALLVSTFERPQHLRRVLLSIALQKYVDGKFEVVVSDDGSRDETAQIVKDFARQASFPVHFTTHPHDGFRLAQCRNEGVAQTTAPYLVFIDGDCIIPPDYVYQHYRHRQPGVARTGNCARLDQQTSERIDEAAIRSAAYIKWVPRAERRRLAQELRKAMFYQLTGNRERPKLYAGTAAMWRKDYERINGYDENFQAWGCEDDDLRRRLVQVGIRVKSILFWTVSYHLWHPAVPSFPKSWREGCNVSYLTRKIRLARCRNGLQKLSFDDLVIRLVGQPARLDVAAKLLPPQALRDTRPLDAEVEVLVLPGAGRFSGRAHCNILVLLDDVAVPERLAQQAHVVVTKRRDEQAREKWHSLDELESVLRAVA